MVSTHQLLLSSMTWSAASTRAPALSITCILRTHFFQLKVALGAVGEVHGPVFLVPLVLGAVVKRHSVVIYRIFELSALVMPGVSVQSDQPWVSGGEARVRDRGVRRSISSEI